MRVSFSIDVNFQTAIKLSLSIVVASGRLPVVLSDIYIYIYIRMTIKQTNSKHNIFMNFSQDNMIHLQFTKVPGLS